MRALFVCAVLLACAGLAGTVSAQIMANVEVKPEVLNLNANGVFTAFVTLPDGYSVRNIVPDSVTCNGVKAVRCVVADDNVFIAKFDRKALAEVPVADMPIVYTEKNSMVLRVCGVVSGQPFCGWDEVKIIE